MTVTGYLTIILPEIFHVRARSHRRSGGVFWMDRLSVSLK